MSSTWTLTLPPSTSIPLIIPRLTRSRLSSGSFTLLRACLISSTVGISSSRVLINVVRTLQHPASLSTCISADNRFAAHQMLCTSGRQLTAPSRSSWTSTAPFWSTRTIVAPRRR